MDAFRPQEYIKAFVNSVGHLRPSLLLDHAKVSPQLGANSADTCFPIASKYLLKFSNVLPKRLTRGRRVGAQPSLSARVLGQVDGDGPDREGYQVAGR